MKHKHTRRNLVLNEVSVVKRGANPGSRILLLKSMDEENSDMSDIDVSKIEDESLRKSIEDLQTSNTDQTQKIEELQKAVEEITSERDELKKSEDPKESMEKEIQELPAHLQKAFDERSEALAKMQEDVAKMQKENLTKELLQKAKDIDLVVKEEDRQGFVDIMSKLDAEDSGAVYKMLQDAEAVVKANGDLFKELGDSTPVNENSAEAEVEKLAEELLAKSENMASMSIARNEIRKAHKDLAKREREEN